jgi:hypothetical protein
MCPWRQHRQRGNRSSVPVLQAPKRRAQIPCTHPFFQTSRQDYFRKFHVQRCRRQHPAVVCAASKDGENQNPFAAVIDKLQGATLPTADPLEFLKDILQRVNRPPSLASQIESNGTKRESAPESTKETAAAKTDVAKTAPTAESPAESPRQDDTAAPSAAQAETKDKAAVLISTHKSIEEVCHEPGRTGLLSYGTPS